MYCHRYFTMMLSLSLLTVSGTQCAHPQGNIWDAIAQRIEESHKTRSSDMCVQHVYAAMQAGDARKVQAIVQECAGASDNPTDRNMLLKEVFVHAVTTGDVEVADTCAQLRYNPAPEDPHNDHVIYLIATTGNASELQRAVTGAAATQKRTNLAVLSSAFHRAVAERDATTAHLLATELQEAQKSFFQRYPWAVQGAEMLFSAIIGGFLGINQPKKKNLN